VCACNDGYFGDACEFTKCPNGDEKLLQCLNGATCLKHIFIENKYLCKCSAGFKGALCEIPLCINYCYNDARCEINANDSLKCTCISERFSGDLCEFDRCYQRICPGGCFMDSTCNCQCGNDCDRVYCSNSNGKCYDNEGGLSCK
jgi:hypothetical protein